jgi:hypothetical protein
MRGVGAVDRRIDQPAADQAAGDADRDQDQDDRQDSMQDVVDPFVGEHHVDLGQTAKAKRRMRIHSAAAPAFMLGSSYIR